jgi:hypothetical protein
VQKYWQKLGRQPIEVFMHKSKRMDKVGKLLKDFELKKIKNKVELYFLIWMGC